MSRSREPLDNPPASPLCFATTRSAPQDVASWRQAERVRLRLERQTLAVEARRRIGQALAVHLDTLLSSRAGEVRGCVVSGYWPIKGELDLRPWMEVLCGRGARLALPVVEMPKMPLVFREWRPGMAMQRGHWGIPVPPPEAAVLVPDIMLAPLVGWDTAGFRLGYGGGYFDRTLASLAARPHVIGVGLQGARIDTIHPLPHDIAMDAIVTEAGRQV